MMPDKTEYDFLIKNCNAMQYKEMQPIKEAISVMTQEDGLRSLLKRLGKDLPQPPASITVIKGLMVHLSVIESILVKADKPVLNKLLQVSIRPLKKAFKEKIDRNFSSRLQKIVIEEDINKFDRKDGGTKER